MRNECCTGVHEFLQFSQTRRSLCNCAPPRLRLWPIGNISSILCFLSSSSPNPPCAARSSELPLGALGVNGSCCEAGCSTTRCTAGWNELHSNFAICGVPTSVFGFSFICFFVRPNFQALIEIFFVRDIVEIVEHISQYLRKHNLDGIASP